MNNAKPALVSELLSPAGINLNLRSNDRDSVLSELVQLVPQLAESPDGRETLLRALRERELLHSTGVGDGVALPHARNALVGLVDACVIALGRHPRGIPFGAIDRVPTQLFFLLIAPTVTQHLSMLARVSRLVRDAKLRRDLLNAATPEQAIRAIHELEAKMQVPSAPIK
jgi:mannitol/fructose-specific phosphotransferase system IIA component (Ntr-type)